MCHNLNLISESLISNLDKSAETRCWTISESNFWISIFFLEIRALKPKSRQNLRKFMLFRRIFYPWSDNGCHWPLHTALWNVWWIMNEPCGQIDFYIHFFFFLHLCSKFSTSRSIKVLKLCQLISSRITAVRMSTCQSIKVTPVKTSNGALLP